ncbi:MAG: polynucleotide adenylyltransferase [Acidobacteria bacterium]|nr:polynucleotide adenylyltransferase [Acidobacteriota bacterium]
MPSPLPDAVVALARAVKTAGGRAVIVGGWVRDDLLGHPSRDFDIEVFGVDAGRLRTIVEAFGRVDAVGESFTVYKVAGLDVSLPRRESKTGRGHRGFTVDGDPDLSLAEAARRRDFTINAISRDPLTGELIDPFGGEADLRSRTLRMVDARTFGDDSLRVLRAMQFAARFELTIDPATADMCRAIPLDDLPSERIWAEFEKLLLQAERPSIGLRLAWDLGIIHKLLPGLVPLATCPQEPEWHPEGDVWTHTLMVVDEARQRIGGLGRGPAVAMMVAAICHDIAKPETTVVIDGRIKSPGHEEAGVEPATRVLDTLNLHTIDGYDVRRAVLGLVAQHLRPMAFFKATPPVSDGAFRRLAQKVDPELLARFAMADCHGRAGAFDCSAMDWFLDRARTLGVEHAAPAPLVLGRHLIGLGVAPGPRMGALLKVLYEHQLDGAITTIAEGLEAARTLLANDAPRL